MSNLLKLYNGLLAISKAHEEQDEESQNNCKQFHWFYQLPWWWFSVRYSCVGDDYLVYLADISRPCLDALMVTVCEFFYLETFLAVILLLLSKCSLLTGRLRPSPSRLLVPLSSLWFCWNTGWMILHLVPAQQGLKMNWDKILKSWEAIYNCFCRYFDFLFLNNFMCSKSIELSTTYIFPKITPEDFWVLAVLGS